MILSIFFDVGQVFVAADFEKFIIKASQQSTKSDQCIRGYLNNSTLIKSYGLGQVNTDTFLRRLKEEINFSGSTFHLATIWSNIFKPIDYNLEIGHQLKSLYKIYAISNTNELHYKKISSFGVYEIFDKIFLSHEVGVSKPDKQIFRIALESTDSKVEESVFIDDSELNVEAARQIGFISQVINKPDELRSILINLGINYFKKL